MLPIRLGVCFPRWNVCASYAFTYVGPKRDYHFTFTFPSNSKCNADFELDKVCGKWKHKILKSIVGIIEIWKELTYVGNSINVDEYYEYMFLYIY